MGQKYVLVTAMGCHGLIAIGSIVVLQRAQAVVVTKAIAQAMLKSKSRLILPYDSAHKISWNH